MNIFSFRNHGLTLVIDDQLFPASLILQYIQNAAGWLLENNINTIGIYANRSLETYIGIFAAFYAGVTYVPLLPKLPQQKLNATVDAANIDAIFFDQAHADTCEATFKRTAVNPLDTMFYTKPPQDLDPNALAYILFTSGSTGTPKGIPVRYANLAHYIETTQARYQFNQNDRFSQFNEITFDLSMFDLMMSWQAHATLAVVPETQLFAPARFIHDQQISVWVSAPSVIGFCHKLRMLTHDNLSSLRYSIFCGEALTTKLAYAWQHCTPNGVVENLYGPAEATISVTSFRVGPCDSEQQFVSIGKPHAGMLTMIKDEELLLAGPQVIDHYLNRPELDQKQFITLTHSEYGEQRWYKTGDKCRIDNTGNLHFLGRLDHQCKINGHRVELEEIELHLRQITGCDYAYALAIPKQDGTGVMLVAMISAQHIDVAHIRKQLQLRVPHYMVPQKITRLDSIPHTIHGKVDRRQLMELIQ